MTTNLQPYPKYKNTGVDWIKTIPYDWTQDKIASLFNFPNDKVNDVDFEPLSVTYGGVKKQVEHAAKTDNGSNRKLLKKGDIAFNGRSDRMGACGVSEYTGSISVVYHVLRKKSPNIDTNYYHHLFRNTLFSQEFYKWGLGIHDDMWTTRILEMKRIQIPVPPLKTQQRIVNFLDEKTKIVDELVAEKEKLLELLREKRIVIITNAVTKGLNPRVKIKTTSIIWLGEIPTSWEMSRLRFLSIGAFEYGANEEATEANPDNPRYIRITDIKENGELYADTFRSLPREIAFHYLLRDGDILFARSGATVGKTFRYKISWGQCCFAGYLIRMSPNLDKILSKYLHYFTQSSCYLGWKNSIFWQATIQNISAEKYKNFIICFPNLDEQKKIIDFLDEKLVFIDKTLKLINENIEMLKEYRSSLIYSVVTGKIKV